MLRKQASQGKLCCSKSLQSFWCEQLMIKGLLLTNSNRCCWCYLGRLFADSKVPIKRNILSVSFLEDYTHFNFPPGFFPWNLGLLQRCAMEIVSSQQMPSLSWIRISRFKERLDHGTQSSLVTWLCKQSAFFII